MRRPPRAFTLVELLVVIGIIAILISVLLPTLAGARSRAASIQCLSNLRQQGQAMVMYANVNRGFIPHAISNAIYALPDTQCELISRLMKGDTKIFYCPTNQLLPPGSQTQILPTDFYPPYYNKPWPGSPPGGTGGRILYWWVGNPFANDYNGPLTVRPPDTDARFAPVGAGYVFHRDSNGNGLLRDEYMRKLGDKNVTNIVVSTDWSGQLGSGNRGWFFLHGKQAWISATATHDERKNLSRSWKNNLYGDGHAEQKRPDEVMWRWGPNGPACW